MKHLLATVTLAVPLVTHAQSFRVKLTQPLPYCRRMTDTVSTLPANQQHPAGTLLQVASFGSKNWYAVTPVSEGPGDSPAATFVRRSALKASSIRLTR